MHANHPAGEFARHRLPERGFGLIELAVAIVVIAIGVLGMAALIPAGTRSSAKSGEVTRASELASQLAEQLLATPYSDADLNPGSHTWSPPPGTGNYFMTWAVEPNQPISSCKRVTITVRWPKSSGPNQAQLVIVSPRANDL